MSMPASPSDVLDARLTSTMTLSGVEVVDGGTLDTWAAWTQATPGNRPFYGSIDLGGGPCVTFGRTSVSINPTTFLANAAYALSIPFSLVMVFRADQPKAAICELSANVSAGRGVLVTNSTGFTAQINGASALQNVDTADGFLWGMSNRVQCVILTCDGTTTALYVNGKKKLVTQTASPGTATATVAATLAAAHAAGLPLTGALGCQYSYARVLNASEIAQATADAGASWVLTPHQVLKYQTTVVGDSIVVGAALGQNALVSAARSFTGAMAAQYGFRFGIPQNLGISGAQLPAILAQYNSLGAPSLQNGPNVNIGEGGINDIGAGSDTATVNARTQALYTAISAAMSAKRAFGPQFCVVTTLFGTAGTTTEALAVSANTRANYLSWGAPGVTMVLADFGADPVLTAANTNYTQDGTHPTIAGAQRAGVVMGTALLAAAA